MARGLAFAAVAFAVELHERADERHVFSCRVAIIALERRDRLVRHIGPAGRQLGIHRIAEVLGALYAVGEIRDALQIATAAVTRWNRAKRPVGLRRSRRTGAPSPAGARRVHGEVAGILDRAFAHLLQVKRARPLQHHWCDLTVAFADMGPQPSRNVERLLRGKRSGRSRQGGGDDDTDDGC